MRYLACSLAIASGFSVPIMLYFYLLQKYGKHNTHKRQLPKFLPKRLILLRHGQSEGNIDPHIYQAMPDNALHLTCMGKEQVRAAGKVISRIVGHDSVVRENWQYIKCNLSASGSLYPHMYAPLKVIKKLLVLGNLVMQLGFSALKSLEFG